MLGWSVWSGSRLTYYSLLLPPPSLLHLSIPAHHKIWNQTIVVKYLSDVDEALHPVLAVDREHRLPEEWPRPAGRVRGEGDVAEEDLGVVLLGASDLDPDEAVAVREEAPDLDLVKKESMWLWGLRFEGGCIDVNFHSSLIAIRSSILAMLRP